MLDINAHHAPSSVFQVAPWRKPRGPEAASESAAVDDEALAGDILGGIGGQEYAQRTQFPPFAETADRNHLAVPFGGLDLALIGGRSLQYKAGDDHVGANIVWPEDGGDRLGERNHSALRGGIGEVPVAPQRRPGGDVDDRPTGSAGHHLSGRGAIAVKVTLQIGGEYFLESLIGVFPKLPAAARPTTAPGISHHHV